MKPFLFLLLCSDLWANTGSSQCKTGPFGVQSDSDTDGQWQVDSLWPDFLVTPIISPFFPTGLSKYDLRAPIPIITFRG